MRRENSSSARGDPDVVERNEGGGSGKIVMKEPDFKLSVAQIVAGLLNNKALTIHFPWLFNPPSSMEHGYVKMIIFYISL